jgi:predicted nuclease with TOPRIM domain
MKPLEALAAGNTLLKKFHNLEHELAEIHNAVTEIKSDVTAMRGEQLRLEGRVSRLEENRETLIAKMELIAAKSEQETKIALATAVADLRSEYARYQAELYKKFLDAQQPRLFFAKSDEPDSTPST